MIRSSVVAVSALCLMAGCASVAVWAAPEKVAKPAQSDQATAANTRFWEALHAGKYDELPQVVEALQAVYLDNPNDPETTAHLGFAHVWALSESSRQAQLSPAVTDHAVLSRKYFEEAVRLVPGEARYQGFYGSMLLAEGTIHHDEKLMRRGYYTLMDSVGAWPEFNLFTAGYTMSRLPVEDPKYVDAVEYQWVTLDDCAEQKFDRVGADFSPYLALDTKTGPKRACWNSWIAPHNYEGFFLNMGDMLVKQGQVEVAKKIYANARASKDFATWPYRAVLEERIVNADQNVEKFRHPVRGEPQQTMMINSAFSCTGCHQL